MEIYRVAFIGHREVPDFSSVQERVEYVVEELLKKHEFVEFYVGRNGVFDLLVASTIKRIKREWGQNRCALILVIPYPVADMDAYEKYYDDVDYPSELKNVHYKAAIPKRNEWIVKRSSMLIAYVNHDYGGAAQCLKKAIEYGLDIVRVDRDLPEYR